MSPSSPLQNQAACSKSFDDGHTAWLSITDDEWPGLRQAFLTWLDPANFDAAGVQRSKLGFLDRSSETMSGSRLPHFSRHSYLD